jgi:capsular exopolysaccharide synthesis family protein
MTIGGSPVRSETPSMPEKVSQTPRASPSSGAGAESPSEGREVLGLVKQSVDPHVVLFHEPNSPVAEQFRTFRTNLLAMNTDGQPRALALTSAVRGEGKSLTTANLALALAELPGTRVLVIDADLRAPSQARLFGIPNSPGLAEVMLDFAPIQRTLVRTDVSGFSLLPAGRAVRNPSELLGSGRLGDLISSLKADFDYIFFDTPPSIPFADAAVLGHRVDGIVYVVRMEQTPRDQSARGLELLRDAGCNVIGSFLSGMRASEGIDRDYVIRAE